MPFHKLIEYNIDLQCLIDSCGEINNFNPGWRTVLGYEKKDLEGVRYVDFVHPDDIKRTQKNITELRQKKQEVDFTNRFRHKNGKYYRLQWRLFFEDENIYAFAEEITTLKKDEETLELFKTSFDISIEEIYWLNKDGNIEYINQKVCENLGYTLEELLKLSIFNINPTITREGWDNLWNSFHAHSGTRKKGDKFESINQRKDGSFYPVEVYPIHVWVGKKEYYLVHVHDISERKKLQLSEKKYRLLFENMTSSFALHKIIYNDEGKAIDYSYVEANHVFEKYVGRPVDSVIGKTVKEMFPNVENYWIELFGEVAQTRKPKNVVMYAKELDMYFEAYVFYTEKDHCAAIFNDVTERIINEENLNKFKASIDYALDGVFWINEKGGFDYVNEQACKMLGYTNEELISLKISDITPNYSFDDFQENWNRLHKNKQFETYKVESWHKRKDGALFPIELNSVFIWRNNSGLLITYVKDISERKQYEETLLKNQKLLVDSQKAGQIGSWEYLIEKDELVWSNQTYEMFGVDNSMKQNYQTFIELVHPEDRISVVKNYNECLDKGAFTPYDYRIIRPDNTLLHVKSYGNIELAENNLPYRTYGIIQDITEQKINEEKILKNQKILTESQRIARMGSWEIDIPNRELYWNDGAINILGLGSKEIQITLEDFWSMILPEDEHIARNHFEETLRTKNFKDFECRFRLSDKNILTILIAGEIIFDDNKNPIRMLGIVQDITERKNIEDSLKESELKMQRILDTAPIGMGILKNRVMVHINPQVSTLSGYSKEELINKDTQMLYPDKEEFERVGNILYNDLKEKGFSKMEALMKRKDGEIINVYHAISYIDPEDTSKGIISTTFDITKQKKFEAQIIQEKKRAEESEYFLKESQQAGNIGSFKYSFKTNQWLFSETLKNIFGVDFLHCEKFALLDNIHPEDQQMIKDYFNKEVIGANKPFDKEYRIIRKIDNETRWLYGQGKIYFDENGNLNQMFGTIQDITERKLIEEELKKINIELENRVKNRTSQLQQANKEMEAFAYRISHDLRAPIRHIDGFIHLLKNAIETDDPKIQSYLEKIALSSRNMSEMINELLKLSRLGQKELDIKVLDLNNIIHAIIEQFKPDYSEREIDWNIKSLPKVNGDPALLKIVFENLISNAIKYTSKKERAIIEIDEKKCDSENTCIFIKDNGIGFDISFKDKLFEVFQRLHRKEDFEGIGIGLTIVKQIIDKHNGKIDVEAEKSKGATFYITLPK